LRAVFVGRFQPFHKGHLRVVEEFSGHHDLALVVVDSGDRTREDPLTTEERINIIKACVDHDVYVQQDYPDNDERWCQELLETTSAEAVITGNDWTQRAVSEYSDTEVIEQEMYRRELYSGTEIRTRIRSGDEWRYLVPDCARRAMEDNGLVEAVRGTSIDYEFEPGWKPEHARN